MREIRTSGSEGGATESNGSSLPLSNEGRRGGRCFPSVQHRPPGRELAAGVVHKPESTEMNSVGLGLMSGVRISVGLGSMGLWIWL